MEKRTLRDEGINREMDDFLEKRPSSNSRSGPRGKKRRKRKHSQNRKMSLKKKRRLMISGFVGIIVLMICMICFSCVGNNKAKNATENALYIDKDGNITEVIVEDWTESYLDEEELEAFIKDEMKTFQKENEGSKLKLQKFEIEDEKIKVMISYDSIESYAEFNQVSAFAGTVKEAEEEVWIYQEELISTQGKPSVMFEELKDTGYTIYVLFEDQKVFTEKEILYTNEGIKVSDNRKTAEKIEATGTMYLVCK